MTMNGTTYAEAAGGVYSSGLTEWPISTAVGRDMQSMEPWFIRRSPVLTRLLDVYGDELETALGLTHDAMAQLFVRTSTWGLTYWEAELGIPTHPGLTDDERADQIVAKMRSYRQGTPFVVRLVANSFGFGTVTPIEDFPGRRLIIRFDDIRGVPSNIPQLQDTLEHLIRASAILEWQFAYLTWGEVLTSGVKWCQLLTAGITWEQLRTMGPGGLPTDVECPAEAPPYLTAVMADSPWGYWNFDDGQVTDSSGNGHNGSTSGGIPTPGAIAGGQGLRTMVGSSSIDIDASTLDFTGDFTLEVWVRGGPDSITKQTTNQNGFSWRLTTGAIFLSMLTPGGWTTVNATGGYVNSTAWHYVAVTKQGSTVTHYLDGQPNGSGTISSPSANFYWLTLGYNGNTDGGGGGWFDEFAVYTTALSAARIAAHYAAASA